MKDIPTIKEIKNNILTAIKTELYSNKADSLMLERSVWGVVATAFAGVFRSLYEFVRYQYRQIFTVSADAKSLELKGEQYSIYRKKGSYTVLKVELESISEGVGIPQNTQLIYKNYIYLTNRSVKTGINLKAEVEATATTLGYNTILQDGTVLDFISPIANIVPTAKVLNTVFRGENEEDIEAYRYRIQNYEQQRPQGGAVPDFILWATEVPEIVDAMIIPVQRTGEAVRVYPIADDTLDSRKPSSNKIQEVQEYLNDPIRRPPCSVEVLEFTELVVDITVKSLAPNEEGTKKVLEQAWDTYLYQKRPRQYSNQVNKDNIVDDASMYSIALSNGVNYLNITKMSFQSRPDLSVPYVLKLGELVKLGKVTYE